MDKGVKPPTSQFSKYYPILICFSCVCLRLYPFHRKRQNLKITDSDTTVPKYLPYLLPNTYYLYNVYDGIGWLKVVAAGTSTTGPVIPEYLHTL